MTGQRRAMTFKLDMLPPPGEALWEVVVDKERRVAGEVLCRNGHMLRDWRMNASIVEDCVRSAVGRGRSGFERGEVKTGVLQWQQKGTRRGGVGQRDIAGGPSGFCH